MLRKLFAVCLLAVVAGQANAVLITSAVGTYDVETISTSFTASTSLLQSQVWFGNIALATEFATLVGNTFGLPNGNAGPFFAVSVVVQGGIPEVFAATFFSDHAGTTLFPVGQGVTYATAVLTSVPEPGTLSLLSAGLIAFGLIRRRRTS